MRKRSSDSSKSNSTTITTPGSSHLDYPLANSDMRVPVAWQHREQNISRPASSHKNFLQSSENKLLYKQHHLNQRLIRNLQHPHQQHQSNNKHLQNITQQVQDQLDCRRLKSPKIINKHHQYLVNKKRVHKQLKHKKLLLQNKQNCLRHSSTPSIETTSSDEEIPIVKHSRRNTASRASNNFSTDQQSTFSQLTRNSQLLTVPTKVISHNNNVVYYPSTAVYRNATLRSTHSVPGIVMQQKIIKKHQLPRQINCATSSYKINECPVHGSTILNPLSSNQETTSLNIYHPHHQNANLRKFASVNDLTKKNLVHNLPKLSNTTCPPPINTALIPLFNNASISNTQTTFALGPIKNVISTKPTSKFFTTNCSLPLPLHPATLATTICAQPVRLNNSQPLLLPAFTNENQNILNSNKYSDKLISYLNAQTMLQRDACCSGYLIVFWIILGVVIIGIITGIVLAVTIN